MPEKTQYEKGLGHILELVDILPNINLSILTRPPGWLNDLHSHSFYEFTMVIDGKSAITFDKKEYILAPGMISLVPPEFPHIQEAKEGCRRFAVALAPDTKNDLVKIMTSYISSPLIANIPNFLGLIPEIEKCLHLPTMFSLYMVKNMVEHMFLCCVDFIKNQDTLQPFSEKLITYFRKNLSENLCIKDISKTLFMSQSLIERLTHKEFDCGAVQLFTRLKIEHACKLLQTTTIPIAEIAAHIGYEDQNYFSKIFKKHTGLSPRDYRKQHGG